jgi:hypothetical protein
MRTSHLVSSLVSALTLTTTTAAFADDADDVASVEAPAFTSFDRSAQGSHAGADLSFSFIDGLPGDASVGSVSRLDLHGAYVHESGFGGYGNLFVSKTFFNDETGFSSVNDQNALSNLELGGVYQRALRSDLDLSVHAGVTLPTADDDAGRLVNLVSSYARFTDLVLAAPNTTWLRFGATPTYRKNGLFVRADVGLDVGLDNDTDMDEDLDDESDTIDPIAHANFGVGYAERRFAVSAELATFIDTGDAFEDDEQFIHTATLSAEYRAGMVTPHLAVSSVLDDEMRGEMVTVTAGVKAGF